MKDFLEYVRQRVLRELGDERRADPHAADDLINRMSHVELLRLISEDEDE